MVYIVRTNMGAKFWGVLIFYVQEIKCYFSWISQVAWWSNNSASKTLNLEMLFYFYLVFYNKNEYQFVNQKWYVALSTKLRQYALDSFNLF